MVIAPIWERWCLYEGLRDSGRLEAQGLTQKQLAARAGITQAVLSRTESGTGNPTLALLEEIAAALGMQLGISFK